MTAQEMEKAEKDNQLQEANRRHCEALASRLTAASEAIKQQKERADSNRSRVMAEREATHQSAIQQAYFHDVWVDEDSARRRQAQIARCECMRAQAAQTRTRNEEHMKKKLEVANMKAEQKEAARNQALARRQSEREQRQAEKLRKQNLAMLSLQRSEAQRRAKAEQWAAHFEESLLIGDRAKSFNALCRTDSSLGTSRLFEQQ